MHITRLGHGPIIYPELDDSIGTNINGPAPIRVPSWVSNPLGKYYLYFAHHTGTYIRLAYADDLNGPWQIYAGGVLKLSETQWTDHLASPDVIIDEDKHELRLYLHGYAPQQNKDPNCIAQGQRSFVARSTDGLHFQAENIDLAPYYLRVFQHKDAWYGIAKDAYNGSVLLRSTDGVTPFETGPTLLPGSRHCAVQPITEKFCFIYFSRIGDKPERILRAHLSTTGDWTTWSIDHITEVLAPIMPWEGSECPCLPSEKGVVTQAVHQLRDPGILVENHTTYLFYSCAGESGIGLARITDERNIS